MPTAVIGHITRERYEQFIGADRKLVGQMQRIQFTIGDHALDLFTDRRGSDTGSELRRFIDYMPVTSSWGSVLSLVRVTRAATRVAVTVEDGSTRTAIPGPTLDHVPGAGD
ncbi:hypothetical protein [Streptomyces sp. NPDC001820]|uniref:hypothetical protein n=1 Tax=Streptomyces sp. NPDC001820 TaxID=3364613 RepID=UPI003690E6BF